MSEYKTEEEFLCHYNPNEFDRLSMTSDILIFSVSDGKQENYRKLKEKYFSVLLVKRKDFPFKGKWCLPGGFIRMDETLEEAATRILAEETNLHDVFLEQLYTFSSVKRDPRMRVVSTAYMALIDKNQLRETLYEGASWYRLNIKEENDMIYVTLENEEETITYHAKKILKDETTNRYELEIIDNDKIAFDHALVILAGYDRLKNKIEYTDIVFNMMPKYFTLGELQQVYEVILGKELLDPAFRRMIKDKVKKTTKVRSDGGHRPSALFEYKKG